ncbi:MAG: hypothetical protein AAF830_15695 [Pseudomonadota bacterium]
MISTAVSFITSPVTRYALIGVGALGFVAWVRHDAAEDAVARLTVDFKEEVEERETAEESRQLAAGQEALAEAEKRAQHAAQYAMDLQEKVDELEDELQMRGVSCPIPDDLRERLLDIR